MNHSRRAFHAEARPADTASADAIPAGAIHTDAVPAHARSGGAVPGGAVPSGTVPGGAVHAPRPRFDGLDALRGATLISMILYHAAWDLVCLFGVPWTWYSSFGAFLWQQSICWTFILLSGYCFHLGRRPVYRGLVVFGGGALVTVVTVLFMPRVFWGVLSLLGAAVLLTVPADRLFRRVPAAAGAGASFALFLLAHDVPNHALGLAWLFPSGTVPLSGGLFPSAVLPLPGWLYRSDLTAVFGFPPAGFYSTDYFPLLPWLFLFWTGYFLYRLCPPDTLPLSRVRVPVLSALGRRSLLVYLLHQPVVYGVLSVWNILR